MTTTELEAVIHDTFLEIYSKKYIGKLEVLKLDPVGYRVILGLNTPLQPFVIHAELEDNDFLKFLRLELRRFTHTYYGELNKICDDGINR